MVAPPVGVELEDRDRGGTSSWDPPCEYTECPPLSPTLECDRGHDAAVAAVVAVRPPSSLWVDCCIPGVVVMVVVGMGVARRIDGEADVCIA